MNVEEIARKLILNVLTQFLLLSISRRSEAQVCHHSEAKKKTRTLLSSPPRGLLSYNLNSCTVMLVGNLVKLCNSPYPLIHSPPLFFFFFFLFFFNQQEERGKGGNKKRGGGECNPETAPFWIPVVPGQQSTRGPGIPTHSNQMQPLDLKD